MSNEKYPGRVAYLNTAEWRKAFKSWMATQGVGAQARLNERFNLADGTISKILSGTIKKSTIIGPLSELAGIALPKSVSDETVEISAALAELRSADPAAYEYFANAIRNHPGVKKTNS